jgi:hypothetical protein
VAAGRRMRIPIIGAIPVRLPCPRALWSIEMRLPRPRVLACALAAAVLAPLCAVSAPHAVAQASTLSGWQYRAIDTMAASHDKECYQLTQSQIGALIATDASAAVTDVPISSPFDDPSAYVSCTPVAGYMDKFVAAARAHGLNIWIRSHWLSWQGGYGVPKLTPTTSPAMQLGTATAVLAGTDTTSYLAKTFRWILSRPAGFWQSGDIFTPASEPENAGILPYCTAPCMFSSYTQFNQWLRDSMTVATAAFTRLGVSVHVGWWGLTCDNRKIDASTIAQMGPYVTDCYFKDPTTLVSKLTALHSYYGVPVVLGEWGDIWDGGAEPATAIEVNTVLTALRPLSFLVGVNYFRDWGGNQGEGIVDKSTLLFNAAGGEVKLDFATMVPPSGVLGAATAVVPAASAAPRIAAPLAAEPLALLVEQRLQALFAGLIHV